MNTAGRWATLAMIVAFGGCAHAKIPNTTIDDTPQNREILAVVADYKRAIERLDVDAVLALVSPSIYDGGGTMAEEDDLGYYGLKERLADFFELTKSFQLTLRVDAVEVQGNDSAYAELYWEFRARSDFPSGTKWDTESDVSRLEFERGPEGNWLIVAGL